MDEPALTLLLQCKPTLNTVRLTVRGEFVEPQAALPEPFDNAFCPEQSRRVWANGISLTKQYRVRCVKIIYPGSTTHIKRNRKSVW